MFALKRIISGGQTGVDQAALRAARVMGLETGGWCPPGQKDIAGVIAATFGLQETPVECSPDAPHIPRSQRTEWNVRDADATLVLAPKALLIPDPGTAWTMSCTRRLGRPLLVSALESSTARERIRKWLRDHDIETLNVAGPSATVIPWIEEVAYAFLQEVLIARL